MELKCYRCCTWPCECKDGQTIIHGDCRNVLPLLPKVDLVLTDPPYNVGINYGEHNDEMTDAEWFEWAGDWFGECRVLAPTLLITGQGRLPMYATMEPWKWLLAWYKPAAMGRSPCGFNHYEPIAMWGKGSNAGLPDVIRAPLIAHGYGKIGHPCPKPLEWAAGILARWPKADSVCDPFVGSGTTLVAAKKLNRRCIGIETEEKYCEIAANRLRQEVLQFTD